MKEAMESEFEIYLRSNLSILRKFHPKKLAYTVTIGLLGTTMLVGEFDTVDTHQFRIISCVNELTGEDYKITDNEVIEVIENYAVGEFFCDLDFEYI